MLFRVNNSLETNLDAFFAAEDRADISRGIVASAATGILAARGIIKKNIDFNYSYFNALTGSSFAACLAGNTPAIIPTNTPTNVAMINHSLE